MDRKLKIESLERRDVLTASLVELLPSAPVASYFSVQGATDSHVYIAFQDGEQLRSGRLNLADESFLDLTDDQASPLFSTQIALQPGQVFFGARSLEAPGYALWVHDAESTESAATRLTPGSDNFLVRPLASFRGGAAFIDVQTTRIWMSDGTVEGTQPVSKRILSADTGPQDGGDYEGYILDMLEIENDLYITGRTHVWKWSGESEDVTLLHDFSELQPATLDLRTVGSQALLRIPSENGTQVWKLDVSSEEFTLSHDWPGRTVSWNDLTVVGDQTYFTAGNFTVDADNFSRFHEIEFRNTELWVQSDDSSERLDNSNGHMIVDTETDGASLLFIQLGEDGNYDLWRLDTETDLQTHIHEFQRIVPQFRDSMAVIDDSLFFFDGSDLRDQPDTLYRWNATDGTQPVKEFAGVLSEMHEVGDRLVFQAADESGTHVWVSDGSTLGTRKIRELFLNEVDTNLNSVPTTNLLSVLDDRLFFSTRQLGLAELWVREPNGTVQALAETRSSMLLVGEDGPIGGETRNLAYLDQWLTDGTRAGTEILRFGEPFVTFGDASSWSPGLLRAVDPITVDDTTYFTKSTPELGAELWARRGGTEWLVRDIMPGEFGSHPENFAVIDGILYFSARDRTTIYRFGDIEEEHEENWELWRSDGTTEGTYKLAELNPAPEAFPVSTSSSNPNSYIPVEGGFVFRAMFDGFARFESSPVEASGWFFSDGTTEGTVRIPKLDGGVPLFAQDQGIPMVISKTGLWFSDGTDEGTFAITSFGQSNRVDILASDSDSTSATFAVLGNDATAIWSTDGTAEGTAELTTIPSSGVRANLLSRSDLGFLVGIRKGNSRNEVWMIEGSNAQLVGEYNGVNLSRSSTNREDPQVQIRSDDGSLYIDDGTHLGFRTAWATPEDGAQSETWRTDGTEPGTFRIESLPIRASDTYWIDGQAYFYFRHPELGRRFWTTDGTVDGTGFYEFDPEGNGSVGDRLVYRDELFVETANGIWIFGDSTLEGDLNDDDIVDFSDFLQVSHNFGKKVTDISEGDVTGDELVDFADFLLISHSFGHRKIPTTQTIEPTQHELDYADAIFEFARVVHQDN